MQSWDALQRELLPCGFHAAVYAAIHCREHGLFRVGQAYGTTRHPCPTCNRMWRPRFLALGLTRRPLPVIEQSNGVKLKAPIGATYVRLITPACSKFEREVRRRKLKLDDQKSLLESAPLSSEKLTDRKHKLRRALTGQDFPRHQDCEAASAGKSILGGLILNFL
jgi:hypothetical protein